MNPETNQIYKDRANYCEEFEFKETSKTSKTEHTLSKNKELWNKIFKNNYSLFMKSAITCEGTTMPIPEL